VLIGGSLLGVLGALLAIPIAATVQIAVKEWWQIRRSRLLPDNVAPPPIAPEGGAA
jgi:predicted PurR-regulated permease PerM